MVGGQCSFLAITKERALHDGVANRTTYSCVRAQIRCSSGTDHEQHRPETVVHVKSPGPRVGCKVSILMLNRPQHQGILCKDVCSYVDRNAEPIRNRCYIVPNRVRDLARSYTCVVQTCSCSIGVPDCRKSVAGVSGTLSENDTRRCETSITMSPLSLSHVSRSFTLSSSAEFVVTTIVQQSETRPPVGRMSEVTFVLHEVENRVGTACCVN